MTTSDELTKAAEYISAHYDAHESSAHLLANHYLSTHADGERVIDDEWLEFIGRNEFTHNGFYFCMAFNYRELGVPYLIWRPEQSNGDYWEAWPVPLLSRTQYLSLLSALGVEVKS